MLPMLLSSTQRHDCLAQARQLALLVVLSWIRVREWLSCTQHPGICREFDSMTRLPSRTSRR